MNWIKNNVRCFSGTPGKETEETNHQPDEVRISAGSKPDSSTSPQKMDWLPCEIGKKAKQSKNRVVKKQTSASHVNKEWQVPKHGTLGKESQHGEKRLMRTDGSLRNRRRDLLEKW